MCAAYIKGQMGQWTGQMGATELGVWPACPSLSCEADTESHAPGPVRLGAFVLPQGQ